MTDVLTRFLQETWHIFTAAAPYVVFGFLAAGLIKAILPDEAVARHPSATLFLWRDPGGDRRCAGFVDFVSESGAGLTGPDRARLLDLPQGRRLL